jgi:hypothetical protein
MIRQHIDAQTGKEFCALKICRAVQLNMTVSSPLPVPAIARIHTMHCSSTARLVQLYPLPHPSVRRIRGRRDDVGDVVASTRANIYLVKSARWTPSSSL